MFALVMGNLLHKRLMDSAADVDRDCSQMIQRSLD